MQVVPNWLPCGGVWQVRQARGAATLVLWVLEANVRGRAFYEALGWEADGTSQPLDMGGFAIREVRYRLGA